MRFGLATVLFLLLQACTPVSYSHISSRESLDKGLEARNAAEKSALPLVKDGSLVNPSGTLDAPVTTTLATARLALAEDARRDFGQANGPWPNASEADRVSALLRAGQKMWLSGRASDIAYTSKIASLGLRKCRDFTEFRPDRDCALIKLMPYLTVLQIQRDVLIDLEIERRSRNTKTKSISAHTTPQVFEQIVAIVKMNKESKKLSVASSEGRADVDRFVSTQQIIYWCAATDAMYRFTLSPRGQRREVQDAALELLGGLADIDAIKDQFVGLGIPLEDANGAYANYTRRIFEIVDGKNDKILETDDIFAILENKKICDGIVPKS